MTPTCRSNLRAEKQIAAETIDYIGSVLMLSKNSVATKNEEESDLKGGQSSV